MYTVAGGKGGVGKTTTALNLAVALEADGTDTAVVDADLGLTNLTELAGIDVEPSIHDVLAGAADVEDAATEGPAGVTVVAGDRDLTANRRADPAELRPVTERLQRDHEAVVVDTGAGLSHAALVPFGLADGVVLVTTPDRTAAVDTGKTAELVRQVGGSVLGTVVTRTDPDADPDLESLADIENLPEKGAEADAAGDPISSVEETVAVVGEPLLGTVPEAPELAGSEPMVTTAPDSDPATAYRDLAERVARHADVESQTVAAADGGGEHAAGATQD